MAQQEKGYSNIFVFFYQALEALGRLGEGFVLPVLDLPLDDGRTFGAAVDNLRGKSHYKQKNLTLA
jgi:hypothetical protein